MGAADLLSQGLELDSMGFPGSSVVKNPSAMQETWVRFLGGGDPLEKGMATHPSILTWKIPWTEEPGELLSMGFQSDATERTCMNTLTHTHSEKLINRVIEYTKLSTFGKVCIAKTQTSWNFILGNTLKKKQQTNICGHLDIGEFFTVPSFL